MKTAELIALLAAGEMDVLASDSAARRFATALGAGASGAALLMATALGVNPGLHDIVLLPMYWAKLAFAGSLAAISLLTVLRLSRPGWQLAGLAAALMAPVLAMWLLAMLALARTPPQLHAVLFFGKTWASCPLLVALLSAPVFVAVIWAMKGLAPTRLRLAGAAAGLLSGAVGALIYCLHCPEIEAPFIGSWYLLGMLIPASIGALAGNRLLRW